MLPVFDTEQLQNLNLISELSILADRSNCKWDSETNSRSKNIMPHLFCKG